MGARNCFHLVDSSMDALKTVSLDISCSELFTEIIAIDPNKAPVVTNKMYRPINGLYVSEMLYDTKPDAPRLDQKDGMEGSQGR